MTVEQPIIEQIAGSTDYRITSRVQLACELVGPPDGNFLTVRLLEAGAGLVAGAEITVHASKVTPD